jgi:hypothetical protein
MLPEIEMQTPSQKRNLNQTLVRQRESVAAIDSGVYAAIGNAHQQP